MFNRRFYLFIVAVAFLANGSVFAAENAPSPVFKDSDGLAIRGYDPVARL